MNVAVYALAWLILLGIIYLAVQLMVGATWFRRFRGDRLIICPETKGYEAVKVNASLAGFSAAMGAPALRLEDCSRWPMRAGCGQECLHQIEGAPESCLVGNIVIRWYEGKQCAVCRRPFGHLHWHDHPPALLDSEQRTRLWRDVPFAELPRILASCAPVCWSCHIALTFRREHPDLIVDRHLKAS